MRGCTEDGRYCRKGGWYTLIFWNVSRSILTTGAEESRRGRWSSLQTSSMSILFSVAICLTSVACNSVFLDFGGGTSADVGCVCFVEVVELLFSDAVGFATICCLTFAFSFGLVIDSVTAPWSELKIIVGSISC